MKCEKESRSPCAGFSLPSSLIFFMSRFPFYPRTKKNPGTDAHFNFWGGGEWMQGREKYERQQRNRNKVVTHIKNIVSRFDSRTAVNNTTSKTETKMETTMNMASFDVPSMIMISLYTFMNTLSFSFDRNKGRVNHRSQTTPPLNGRKGDSSFRQVDQQR